VEHLIPFGVEVDMELGGAEHLTFGFWTRDAAERLKRLLQRVSAW